MDQHRVAERAARESFARLLAYLAARSRDVAAAEDALSEALLAALEDWPRLGVPDKPEAWLLAVARRRMVDAHRHQQVTDQAQHTLVLAAEEAQETAERERTFPDERLRLLYACAHPAIDPAARTPLVLQVVLGLTAARIASAFLVAPAAMGQRLVRAKAKILDAGIPFSEPAPDEREGRTGTVLEAIYAAYGSGWEDDAWSAPTSRGLAEEALWLGQSLASMLPDDPEVLGLYALMLHCEARRAARRDDDGRYVPLSQQDVRRWSRPLIDAAERALLRAASFGRLGRFQLEAAIQSAHNRRVNGGAVDWAAIVDLYDGLVQLAPSLGAFVGRAAAIADARGPHDGLATLDALDPAQVATYQPYWATRAALLERAGAHDDARLAYERALGLSEDPAVRELLARRLAGL